MKDLKFSRYAVPVKLDNGDVFLLNGLTGAIDIVDAVTYRLKTAVAKAIQTNLIHY